MDAFRKALSHEHYMRDPVQNCSVKGIDYSLQDDGSGLRAGVSE